MGVFGRNTSFPNFLGAYKPFNTNGLSDSAQKIAPKITFLFFSIVYIGFVSIHYATIVAYLIYIIIYINK
nr:MAG TPA: hypothetical protein [Caudoviricetes sp.]